MNTEANQFFADSPQEQCLQGCQQRIDLPALAKSTTTYIDPTRPRCDVMWPITHHVSRFKPQIANRK
jgi:hypothetical protein